MATVTLRSVKGAELSINEADSNINNLNTDKIELTNLSVTQNSASGGGTLSYNNTTGVFDYTPPSIPAAGIANVVEDTTPQLGGDLDLNSSDITGTGNVDITGTVVAQSTLNTQTSTTYTLVLTDASKLVTLNNASAIT